MTAVLTEFVNILVGGIVDLAKGIANGVAEMASALFLKTGEQGAVTGLSTFGGICAIFTFLPFTLISLVISFSFNCYIVLLSVSLRI